MNRNFIAALLSLSVLLPFTQCNKEDTGKVFNANFYTTKANGTLLLYVDDVYKGELPYLPKAPDCSQAYSDGARPLVAQLPSGKYEIVGKNEQGQMTSRGTIVISSDRMSASGGIGGLSLINSGDCLSVGLSE